SCARRSLSISPALALNRCGPLAGPIRTSTSTHAPPTSRATSPIMPTVATTFSGESAGCARAACPARHSASVAARLLIVEVEFMSGTYLSNPFRFVHLCVTISVSLIYEPDRSASSPRWLRLLVGLAEDRLGQFLGDGELAGAFRGTRPAAHQRDAQQVAGGLGAR